MYRVHVRGAAEQKLRALPEGERSAILEHVATLARGFTDTVRGVAVSNHLCTESGDQRLFLEVSHAEQSIGLTEMLPRPTRTPLEPLA